MTDVVNLKLVSGEELIASLVESNIQKVTLDAPLLFVVTHNKEESSNNVSFAPWMVGRDSSEHVDISKDHILAISKPTEDAKQAYLDITGKGTSELTSSPRQVLNG